VRGKKTEQVSVVDAADVVPPRVLITNPVGGPLTLDTGALTVEALARPAGKQPVESLQLLVNGRPFPSAKGQFDAGNAGGKPATASATRAGSSCCCRRT